MLATAPTGSGKTLAAFLWSIHQLLTGKWEPGRVRVLYVSPLKALNNDVERNLLGPLAELQELFAAEGVEAPTVRVATRSGDTSSSERQRMLRKPPEILITTPESMNILLTSDGGRGLLTGIQAVILDEIHAVAGSKRGTHLMTAVERLVLLNGEFQRIALSATVRPLERIARFVGGRILTIRGDTASYRDRDVAILDAAGKKAYEVLVEFPATNVDDPTPVAGTALRGRGRGAPDSGDSGRATAATHHDAVRTAHRGRGRGAPDSGDPGHTTAATHPPRAQRPVPAQGPTGEGSKEQPWTAPLAVTVPTSPYADDEGLWQAVTNRLEQRIHANRSTLIFTNSRRMAEKITRFLNHDEAIDLAYSHHGSLSKEIRAVVEERFKGGELSAIVATSTLELGIDIGDLDEVLLIQTPSSTAAAVQRVGRAGHSVGAVSKGRFFPLYERDLMEAAVAAKAVLEGEVEPVRPVEGALDVLSQVILSMVANDEWELEALYDRVRASDPYRDLPRKHFDLVLDLLAGRYADSRIRELVPRVTIDRVSGTVRARRGSRRILYQSGGTIPDRGYFHLRLQGSMARLGELDEEFVWERSVGDTFTLGAQSWRIQQISHNDVLVTPARSGASLAPFWRGEELDRSAFFAERVGDFLEWAESRFTLPGSGASEQGGTKRLKADLLASFPVDEKAAETLTRFLHRQRSETGTGLPHRHRILLERVRDPQKPTAEETLVLHTFWGGRVNRPFGIALSAAWERKFGTACEVVHDDDSLMLHLPHDATTDEILELVAPDQIEELLRERLERTGFFGARFRENAGRALLLPRGDFRRRVPLWLNRQRAKKLLETVDRYGDFPVVLETWRTALRDEMEVEVLRQRLIELAEGTIHVAETVTSTPSPFAANLRWKMTNKLMYEDDTPEAGAGAALGADLVRELVFSSQLRPKIDAKLVEQLERKLQRTFPGYAPDPEELVAWVEERLLVPEGEWGELLAAVRRDHGLEEAEMAAVLEELGERLVHLVPPSGVDAAPVVRTGLRGRGASAPAAFSDDSAAASANAEPVVGTAVPGRGRGVPSEATSSDDATAAAPNADPVVGTAVPGRGRGVSSEATSSDDTTAAAPNADPVVTTAVPGRGRGVPSEATSSDDATAVAPLPRAQRPVPAQYGAIGDDTTTYVAALTALPRLCQTFGWPLPALAADLPAPAEPPDDVPPFTAILSEWLRCYGPVPESTLESVFASATPEDTTLPQALEDLVEAQLVVVDEIRTGAAEPEICDVENLERLLRMARAEARPELEALPLFSLPHFLAVWQGLAPRRDGVEGLQHALERLFGFPAPAEAWETEILTARLDPYHPAWLDSLMQETDLLWVGAGKERLTFLFAEDLDLIRDPDAEPPEPLDILPDPEGVYTLPELLRGREEDTARLTEELWQAAWEGRVTNDAFTVVRDGIDHAFQPRPVEEMKGKPAAGFPRGARRRGGFARWQKSRAFAGRWFALPGYPGDGSEPDLDPLEREELNKDRARLLLGRYGVLFRELLSRELPAFQWSRLFRALRLLELSGEIVAGHFFHGIPGLQFATPAAVRRIREGLPEDLIYWMNAIDLASPSGTGLEGFRDEVPRRVSSSHMVFHGSRLVLVSEASGKRLDFRVPEDDPNIGAYLEFLVVALGRRVGARRSVEVEEINGVGARESGYLGVLGGRFQVSGTGRGVRVWRRY